MSIPLPQPGPKYDANNEAQTRSAITRFFAKVFNRDSDKDLAALEDLDGTGMLARTAAETFALRTLTAGSGIGVANGDGVSGNPTVSITDAELLAIAGLTSAADRLIRFTGSGTADLITIESGLWTPRVFGSTAAGTATYVSQDGAYLRILDWVFASYSVNYNTHTGTGDMLMDGLPYSPSATYRTASALHIANLTYSNSPQASTFAGSIRFADAASGGFSPLAMDAEAVLIGLVGYKI